MLREKNSRHENSWCLREQQDSQCWETEMEREAMGLQSAQGIVGPLRT